MDGQERGPVIGAIVSGVATALWTVWGSGGLAAPAAVIVAVVGVLAGLAVVVAAVRALRGTRPGSAAMFRSRAYRLITLVEVAAIVAGAAVLGALGQGAYVITWTAFVVGVHFLAFGRVFAGFFTAIGVALVVAAVLGVVLGLGGAAASTVVAVCGLLCALVFLAAGVRGLTRRPAPSSA